jgi:GntR family transcriptional repressor for pyruvate dehydrogenase complex
MSAIETSKHDRDPQAGSSVTAYDSSDGSDPGRKRGRMNKPVRRNLSHAIADELLERVRDSRLRVGDRLPTLEELMREFGVGRGVARDAVQQLASRGIVDVRPRRGAVIVGVQPEAALDSRALSALLDDQAVEDLYALRRLVEVAVAGQAAERAARSEIAAIGAAHERFRLALEGERPPTEADIAFHRAIAVAAHNAVYVVVLDTLAEALAVVREEQAAAAPESVREALDEHAAVLEAIDAGDPERARLAMTRHLEKATRGMRQARSRRRRQAASSTV